MAIKPLQTITLKNEGGDDITYTLSGEYPDLIAGSAEQIISDEYTENKVPYLLRASNFGSRREDDTLVGGTVAWNQIFSNALASTTTTNGVTVSYADGVYSFSGTASADVNFVIVNIAPMIQNHVYLKPYTFGSGSTYFLYGSNGVGRSYSTVNVTKATNNQGPQYIGLKVVSGTNMTGVKISVSLFDLTQMFGSTIADHIYSLEQATTGAGVAWFRNLFPAFYYPYNAGELMSVSGVEAHKMVGFNAWDEEWELGTIDSNGAPFESTVNIRSKNFIPAIGGATYYIKSPYSVGIGIYQYDANKNYITSGFVANTTVTLNSNARYIKFRTGDGVTTYKNDICINLSSSRNGQYEPYKAISYPLDDSLTLRGIPKLDANNSLYYDGDTYQSDGTVTRKYGIVDLGTLTWSVYTSGDNSAFYASLSDARVAASGDKPDFICGKYEGVNATLRSSYMGSGADKTMIHISSSTAFYVKDSAYATAAAFKTAMDGVYLVYELATPTTETANSYTNPQNVDPDGTEEYVSTSIVPVGHDTKYFADLVERLAAIPEPPTSNGTYRLIATVSGGVTTLSWVAN